MVERIDDARVERSGLVPDITPVLSSPGRRGRWIAGLIVLALVAGGTAWWLTHRPTTEPTVATEEPVELDSAEAVLTDLIETATYDGTLGRLQGDTLSVRRGGTVTAIPSPGDVLDEGDVLIWIDNRPVMVLQGEIPAWRSINRRSSDDIDILQLETRLTNLGYNPGNVTVDGEFTANTRDMVEAWQEDTGADADGSVDLGEVMFLPEPVRVDEVLIDVGDVINPGSPVVATSSDEIQVTFGLPTTEQGSVELGSTIDIVMPDLRRTTGTVVEIATVATRPTGGGEATFTVTVDLDDPGVAAGIDEAPVDVEVVVDRADDVLAVPVTALVALLEGGYAVEVDTGSGIRLVAVEPGFYADGLVAVTGDIRPGNRVVVP